MLQAPSRAPADPLPPGKKSNPKGVNRRKWTGVWRGRAGALGPSYVFLLLSFPLTFFLFAWDFCIEKNLDAIAPAQSQRCRTISLWGVGTRTVFFNVWAKLLKKLVRTLKSVSNDKKFRLFKPKSRLKKAKKHWWHCAKDGCSGAWVHCFVSTPKY